LTGAIARTKGITDTVASNPQSRKIRGLFGVSMTEKWCEIYRTAGHDLEVCKTFLDWKTMPPPAAPAPQEARRVDQRRADSDGDEQMGEINIIFGGSMSIASKTQGRSSSVRSVWSGILSQEEG
jgi:hypothetical protein